MLEVFAVMTVAAWLLSALMLSLSIAAGIIIAWTLRAGWHWLEDAVLRLQWWVGL